MSNKEILIISLSDWYIGTKEISDELWEKLKQWVKSSPLADVIENI